MISDEKAHREWLGLQDCTCSFALKNLGMLYGISMGKGWIRINTADNCIRHNPKTHNWVPHVKRPWCTSTCGDMCHQCNHRKKDHSDGI